MCVGVGGCFKTIIVVVGDTGENSKSQKVSLTILTARKPVFLKIRSDEENATTFSVLPTCLPACG